MRVNSFRQATLLAAMVFLATTLAFSQGTTTGTVTGVVADETGAVLPGADVVLKNEATGATRATRTNAQGAFRFDQVPPGEYSVTVTAAGFRTLVTTGIDVRVGRTSDIGFRRMEIGGLEEVVEVRGDAVPLVESQTAQISGTFDAKQVVNLRSGFGGGAGGLDVMAALTPGVTPGFGNVNANGMQVSANGQRSRSTQFNLDGLQMNDITIGGPSFFISNLDAVAEYQVVTNQFDASLGRNLGATVNLITKSGTNNVRGAVSYGYFANALRSRTAFESRDEVDKPKFLEHRWSANAGGPIIRNELFWYFSYGAGKDKGGSLSQGPASQRVITPRGVSDILAVYPGSTPAQFYRDRGPFSVGAGNPTCRPGTTITVPGPRSVPGDPTSAPIPVEVCQMQRNLPGFADRYEIQAKGDFVRGNHTLSGGYMVQNVEQCCFGGGSHSSVGWWLTIPNRNDSVRFTWNYNFSPQTTNLFKFSYGRFLVAFEGVPSSGAFPVAEARSNITNISMPSNFAQLGLNTNFPQNRLLNSYQFSDIITLQRGRHTIKVGGDLNLNRTSLFFLPFLNAQFGFTTLQAFADNTPTAVTFASGATSFDPVQFDRFVFVQDDIRLRPNLTINLGLRYEYSGQPINKAVDEVLKRETDPSTALWLQTVPLEARTIRRAKNDRNNFAPRIGFAWTPEALPLLGDGKTVIRGGYGMSYELAFYNILLNMTTAAPRVFLFSLPTGTFTAPPLPSSTATGADVAAVIPTPVNTFDPRRFSQTQLSEDFHSPYGQNWTLGIQREIGRRQVMEVRYVGTNAIGQFQSVNANPLFSNLAADFPQFVPAGVTPCTRMDPNPSGNPADPPVPAPGFGRPNCDFAAVRVRDNSGFSNYHSLQVRYDARNLFDQFTGGAAYTWAKGIDNVSEIFSFFGDGSIAFSENPFDFKGAERGESNFSLRHTLSLHYIWESPFLRTQEGVLGKILGGWQLSGITRIFSGRPWTPVQFVPQNRYCGQDVTFNRTFIGTFGTCRPFLANPSAAVNAGRYEINNDANVAVFGTPFGVGRNTERGEYTQIWDIAVDKRFRISETANIRYRMSMANAFNRRNRGVPPVFRDLGTFGDLSQNNVGGREIRMRWWFEW